VLSIVDFAAARGRILMPVKYDVVALGNAIMDVIAQVDDDFLVKHDIPKARTNLITTERCDYLYNALPASRVETSGGSAGNTIDDRNADCRTKPFDESDRTDRGFGPFEWDLR
jgi:hypothetical protein